MTPAAPTNRLRPYAVSHRLDNKVELEDFLARAFSDEWGDPVKAWRLSGDRPLVTYDLLWHGSPSDLDRKLREAGAEDVAIGEAGPKLNDPLVIP